MAYSKIPTDSEASNHGIDSLDSLRSELIKSRDRALIEANFEVTTFLSHIIWWLSVTEEVRAHDSQ